jgi:hypothetical protein
MHEEFKNTVRAENEPTTTNQERLKELQCIRELLRISELPKLMAAVKRKLQMQLVSCSQTGAHTVRAMTRPAPRVKARYFHSIASRRPNSSNSMSRKAA